MKVNQDSSSGLHFAGLDQLSCMECEKFACVVFLGAGVVILEAGKDVGGVSGVDIVLWTM